MTEAPHDATAARRIAEHLLTLRTAEPADLPPRDRAPPPLDYPRLQRRMHWFDGLLRVYRAVAQAVADQLVDRPADQPAEPSADRAERGAPVPGAAAPLADPLIEIVRSAHRLLLEHPVAARRAYAALAAQGRAYAETPDGAELSARLARSHRLRRASRGWRSLAMGMLDDPDPGELPVTYLDNLLRVIDHADLEQLLGRVQRREAAP